MACVWLTHAYRGPPTARAQQLLRQLQLPESQCYLQFAASSSPALPFVLQLVPSLNESRYKSGLKGVATISSSASYSSAWAQPECNQQMNQVNQAGE
jgi:hypothetical protein